MWKELDTRLHALTVDTRLVLRRFSVCVVINVKGLSEFAVR